MMKRIALTALAAAATFTTAAFAPAVVAPAAAQSLGIYIGTPPQPRYYAPPVQRVWAPGYWTWHHGRQVWVDGHWVTRTVAPAPGWGPGWSPGWTPGWGWGRD
jgi:Spy/CpxP family protein refolding chaperone